MMGKTYNSEKESFTSMAVGSLLPHYPESVPDILKSGSAQPISSTSTVGLNKYIDIGKP